MRRRRCSTTAVACYSSFVRSRLVRGDKVEGTTTPFDMVALNQTSRYDICMDAIRRARRKLPNAAALTEECERMLDGHRVYAKEHLEDMPEIRDSTWVAT